jgi:hypothetical protein
MDFFEAMEEVKEGGKVRLKSWPEGAFIGVKEEEVKVFGKRKTRYTIVNSDESDIPSSLPFSALVKAEWELFRD